MNHLALYCSNAANKTKLINAILHEGILDKYIIVSGEDSDVFSALTIDQLIEEEFKHESVVVTTSDNNNLESMSSGQQKVALLQHLLKRKTNFLILDDIKSNIDKGTYEKMELWLSEASKTKNFIQIVHRKEDVLKSVKNLLYFDHVKNKLSNDINDIKGLTSDIEFPLPLIQHFSQYGGHDECTILVEMNNVSVAYMDKKVVSNLNWTIKSNEFWELRGPIGSGKSTVLSMIIGDNPKAYGLDITLFGKKKGSGETVWDIKRETGYFYPKMLQLFKRNYTNQEMIISGFYDSVGLYSKPTEYQQFIAAQWLEYLGKEYLIKKFQQLSSGQQRIIMMIRALIKNPRLLILDEPTAGLDDENAMIFTKILNEVLCIIPMAVIYVSHRKESGLNPDFLYELIPTKNGSIGIATKYES